MNAQQYLQSKGIFMPEEKRRYKIVVRNGFSVFVLVNKQLSLNMAFYSMRIKKVRVAMAALKRIQFAKAAINDLGVSLGRINSGRFDS